MILASVSVLLAIVYGCIQLVYTRAWQSMPEWRIPEGFEPEIPVTVVVAARNESSRIKDCLQSIINGSYPQTLLEIIVVDDFFYR